MTFNQNTNTLIRLKFLRRVVHKECQHLISTDKRLFDTTFTIEPRFSISACSEADQEVEDVREKAKIVRKA